MGVAKAQRRSQGRRRVPAEGRKSLVSRHCSVRINQRFLSTYYVPDITLVLGRQSHDQQTP